MVFGLMVKIHVLRIVFVQQSQQVVRKTWNYVLALQPMGLGLMVEISVLRIVLAQQRQQVIRKNFNYVFALTPMVFDLKVKINVLRIVLVQQSQQVFRKSFDYVFALQPMVFDLMVKNSVLRIAFAFTAPRPPTARTPGQPWRSRPETRKGIAASPCLPGPWAARGEAAPNREDLAKRTFRLLSPPSAAAPYRKHLSRRPFELSARPPPPPSGAKGEPKVIPVIP